MNRKEKQAGLILALATVGVLLGTNAPVYVRGPVTLIVGICALAWVLRLKRGGRD